MLGGNSTLAGVNTWEPGLGPALAAELYDMLSTTPSVIGISRTVKHWSPDQPWGLSRIDRALSYETTLQRAGVPADRLCRVTFEPSAMAAAMAGLLVATGRVDLRLGAKFTGAETDGNRVTHITISCAGREERLAVGYVADTTAQLHVCRELGCATYLGCEPRSLYNEPSAPDTHLDQLNGVTVCFRVTPVSEPRVEPLPPGVPDEVRTGVISMTEYPCGDLNMNILPVMQGWEYHTLGEEEGRRICVERVHQIWRWYQGEKGFDRYRLAMVFPFTGIREGPRLIGRKVLTENDIRLGHSRQPQPERLVALADHALDVHGAGHLCRELSEPYGIPYECLLPREYDNLIVACRGASFSHLAASSCRLSRTMMALGVAAGRAMSQALPSGAALADVNPVA